MTRLITIVLCLVASAASVLGAANMPNGAKLAWLLMQPVVAPPALTFTTTPATVFTLFASADLRTPRTSWTNLGTGTNSLAVPITALAGITNPPAYSTTLAWNRAATNAGTEIDAGTSSGNYTAQQSTRGTNTTFVWPDNRTRYYAGKSYWLTNAAIQSNFSAEVSAVPMPPKTPQSQTVFFCCTSAISTRLNIKSTPN